MTSDAKKWVKIGGGTSLVPADGLYPCDDMYEHEDSKMTFTVLSNREAHAKMPERVRKPSDLRRWSGVKSVSTPVKADEKVETHGKGQVSEPEAIPLIEPTADEMRAAQGA